MLLPRQKGRYPRAPSEGENSPESNISNYNKCRKRIAMEGDTCKILTRDIPKSNNNIRFIRYVDEAEFETFMTSMTDMKVDA